MKKWRYMRRKCEIMTKPSKLEETDICLQWHHDHYHIQPCGITNGECAVAVHFSLPLNTLLYTNCHLLINLRNIKSVTYSPNVHVCNMIISICSALGAACVVYFLLIIYLLTYTAHLCCRHKKSRAVTISRASSSNHWQNAVFSTCPSSRRRTSAHSAIPCDHMCREAHWCNSAAHRYQN